MMNVNSDDYNLTNMNKPVVVGKVAVVPETILIGGSPVNSNVTETKAAVAEQNSAEEKVVSKAELDDSVRDLNEHMQVAKRELHFSVDNDSGQTVIKVMDLATQQVIRQIPNEEALKAARSLGAGFDLELFSEYT